MTLPLGTDTGNRTVVDERPFTLEPDRAFLGCLMQTSVAQARQLLAGIRPDDAHSPIAQLVLHLVIRLAVDGIKPDPVVLLSEARNQGWLTSEYRHEQFATWLIDTFRAAPLPEAAPVVKADMLEEALRWAIHEQAGRALELVEHGPIDTLREQANLETDRIADLWQRLDTAGRAITPASPVHAVYDHISAQSDRLSRPQPTGTTTPTAEAISTAETRSQPAQDDHATEGKAA